jgi:hypothetical protein
LHVSHLAEAMQRIQQVMIPHFGVMHTHAMPSHTRC